MINARRRKRATRRAARPSSEITLNHGPATNLRKAVFLNFACNAKASLVRHDEMEGEKYLVVPMIMMVVGVHRGSGGPLLYNADELGKTPEVWNHKPVVVYHPTKNGKGISACDPDTLTTHKIGVIMNAEFDALGRLKAEAWLKEDRVRKVDPRILEAIEKKEVLELSTGLFTDNEMTEGEHEGEHYDGIARNFRPDHLAVLPDKIGACSVADGAGFLRNELASMTGAEAEDLELLRGFIVTNLQKAGKGKGAIADLLKKAPFSGLLENELSHEQLREQVQKAITEKYPPTVGEPCYYPWIEAVYEDFVVYCYDGKLFKIGYTFSEAAGVKLAEDQVQVVRVTEYRTVSGAYITGNAAERQHEQKSETPMNKKQLVDGLIANGGYSEENRTALMAMDEATLTALKTAGEKLVANAAKPNTPATVPAVVINADPAAAAPAKKPQTDAEFLAAAPAGVRAVIQNAERIQNVEKERHIAAITANTANKFTREQLMAKDLPELGMLAELATGAAKPAGPVDSPSFLGNGFGAAPLVANATGDDKPLVMQTMTFDAPAGMSK